MDLKNSLAKSISLSWDNDALTIPFLLIYESWALWRSWVFSLYLYYAMVERGWKSPLYKIITFELADLSPAFLEMRSEIYSFTIGFTATLPRKDVLPRLLPAVSSYFHQ